jgi:hypothetical protein
MTADTSFRDFVTRLYAGDEDAAVAFFHRDTHRLLALARSHLDGRLR